jgi:hypothetical protein
MLNQKPHKSTLVNTVWLLSLIIIVGGQIKAHATTYYVDTGNAKASDSNTGSQALPWKTIGKANTVMVGGDTAIIKAGTYNERIATVKGGAAGKKITFSASGTVKIMGGVAINHAFVTVKGFDITGDVEISLNGNNCEVLNNHLVNSRIFMSHWTTANPANCLLQGNHIESNSSWGSDWTAVDLGGSKHIVEKNEIGPSKDTDAFRPWGVGHIIRNNYIHDITLSPGSGSHMDVFQVFADNGDPSTNIVFENNRIINFNGQMFMTSMDGLNTIHDFDVRNNLWVNVGGQGNVGVTHFRFYNNTLYNVGYYNGFALYLYNAAMGDPSHARIMNNIFIGAGGLDKINIDGPYIIAKGTDVQVDYNLVAAKPGSSFVKLNDFTEKHGINGSNPMFANIAANDFHILKSSPAVNRGVTVNGFNRDLDGVTRPQGAAWDIGAYEFKSGTVNVTAPETSISPPQPPTNLRIN